MIVGDPALRANELLLETRSFDELGLDGLAARARMVARDNLDLLDMLDAERAARVALQAGVKPRKETVSLAINIDRVSHVLLADGWHRVEDKSFYLDAYEYVEGDGELIHGDGTGFRFKEELDENAGTAYEGNKVDVTGPLTSILAVMETL